MSSKKSALEPNTTWDFEDVVFGALFGSLLGSSNPVPMLQAWDLLLLTVVGAGFVVSVQLMLLSPERVFVQRDRKNKDPLANVRITKIGYDAQL